ncbi:hypothetical protein GHT06_020492 [Daphnia sinensis]|uniref:CxC3 like cysteine cluster domain-containing protein n=1 Tax=Daphnia sinensis TaxID=1820382 RepID=A0AAD5KIG8_9CRUS|nr:hypothetical protein GHT06_020492 [Daphnia sinensis]
MGDQADLVGDSSLTEGEEAIKAFSKYMIYKTLCEENIIANQLLQGKAEVKKKNHEKWSEHVPVPFFCPEECSNCGDNGTLKCQAGTKSIAVITRFGRFDLSDSLIQCAQRCQDKFIYHDNWTISIRKNSWLRLKLRANKTTQPAHLKKRDKVDASLVPVFITSWEIRQRFPQSKGVEMKDINFDSSDFL